MPLRPPLTPDELRAIYERKPTEEVRLLLWEIERLHGLVFNLAEFIARLHPARLGHGEMQPLASLLIATDAEPSVSHRRAKREANRGQYLQAPAVLGCEMVEPFIGPPERWEINARAVGLARHKRRR